MPSVVAGGMTSPRTFWVGHAVALVSGTFMAKQPPLTSMPPAVTTLPPAKIRRPWTVRVGQLTYQLPGGTSTVSLVPIVQLQLPMAPFATETVLKIPPLYAACAYGTGVARSNASLSELTYASGEVGHLMASPAQL